MRDAVAGCVRNQIQWIAAWRHKLTDIAAEEAGRIIADAGLRVSSLCRGGYFPAASAAERQKRIGDNHRAVDQAAALGTDVLVLVCGPSPDRDIDGARRMVEEGIAATAPYAKERGIRLGIEPLHPMFAGDRSVIVTLGQAIDLAAKFSPEEVGVIIDVYHVWWDPQLYAQIARAQGRILGFHVNDWLSPPPDVLMGRGMMGDGSIELRRIRQAVDDAGYAGPVEVEIFNQALWDSDGDQVCRLIKQRFVECC
jgi:sugar phosphate isomerase/epimerase